MNELFWGIITALWLGILCSISPCPLATNIAAVSFIGRRVDSVKKVLLSGLLYTIGRTLTYAVLGAILVGGLTAAPELSHVLQKYMNKFMGPLLVVVGMILLNMISLSFIGGVNLKDKLQGHFEKLGLFSSLFMGIIFALSFCPSSAALFFGAMLPVAIELESPILLPTAFGVATGIVVLFFSFLLAFSANMVGKAYKSIAKFERVAQIVTGYIFIVVGIFMTIILTLGVKLW